MERERERGGGGGEGKGREGLNERECPFLLYLKFLSDTFFCSGLLAYLIMAIRFPLQGHYFSYLNVHS